MMKRLGLACLHIFGSAVKTIVVGIVAVALIAIPFAIADYNATVPGSGTSFASKVITAVHYAAFLMCDATAGESQCAAVDASGHVQIGVADGASVTIGAKADAKSTATDTTPVSAMSVWKEISAAMQSLLAALNANGQAPMSGSAPVTIASDQAGTCTNHAFKHITTATDTLAVQGVTAQTVRLCAWKARAAGTATWFWENTASTNANCASALTQISGVATEAANTGEVVSLPLGVTLNNTSANGLCINSTGTGGVDIDFWYAQR